MVHCHRTSAGAALAGAGTGLVLELTNMLYSKFTTPTGGRVPAVHPKDWALKLPSFSYSQGVSPIELNKSLIIELNVF